MFTFFNLFFKVSLCQNNRNFETYNKNPFGFFSTFSLSQHVFHRMFTLISPRITRVGLSGLNVSAISGSFQVDSPIDAIVSSTTGDDLPQNCACKMPAFGFCCGQTKHRIGSEVTEYTFRLI